MRNFITRRPKQRIQEYVQHKLCFQANIGMDLKGSNIYFVAHVIPFDESKVFYGCAWGPKLFNGFCGLLEDQPETEHFFSPYWPTAVQYIKNRKAGDNETPRLINWDARPEMGVDEMAWRLGYFVEDVDFKDIIHLSDFNFAHILKVLQLNVELLIELMDDHIVHRFATDHGLYELGAATPFLSMFGSPKIFSTFGITQKDIGDPKGGMFMPLWRG